MPLDDLSERFEKVLAEVLARVGAHHAPLAREYAAALEAAARLRAEARARPFTTLKSGRELLNPAFEAADREVRRAMGLAKLLGLDGPAEAAKDADPFVELDAATPTSISERRKAAAGRNGAAVKASNPTEKEVSEHGE
jgi:cell pole-organizing protein PopZ